MTVSPTLIIDGRASVVVCAKDLHYLTPDVRVALERELEVVVREEHFRMAPICQPKAFSEAAAHARERVAEAGVDATPPNLEADRVFTAKRKDILERFNKIIGTSVIRRLDCAFGWGESF